MLPYFSTNSSHTHTQHVTFFSKLMKSVATVSVQVQEQLSDVWQVQQRNLFLIGGGTDLSDCCSPFQWSRLRFLIAHTFRRQYNTSGQIRFDCDWSMDTSPLFPSPSLSSSSSMSVDGCHCGNSLTHTHIHCLTEYYLGVCVWQRVRQRGTHSQTQLWQRTSFSSAK